MTSPAHLLTDYHSLGNLPFSATEAEILEFLNVSKDAARCTVEIVCAASRPFRKLGFGFVTVPTELVETVLECNGGTLSGRQIKGEYKSLETKVKLEVKGQDGAP